MWTWHETNICKTAVRLVLTAGLLYQVFILADNLKTSVLQLVPPEDVFLYASVSMSLGEMVPFFLSSLVSFSLLRFIFEKARLVKVDEQSEEPGFITRQEYLREKAVNIETASGKR